MEGARVADEGAIQELAIEPSSGFVQVQMETVLEQQFDAIEIEHAAIVGAEDQEIGSGVRAMFEESVVFDPKTWETGQRAAAMESSPDQEVTALSRYILQVSEDLTRYTIMVSEDMDRMAAWIFDCTHNLHPIVAEYIDPHKELTLQWLPSVCLVLVIVCMFFVIGILQGLFRRFSGWGTEDESYKETAANLANSMRMLIDKQSKEMHALSNQKRMLEEHVTALQAELDRIIAAIENSNGETSSLHAIANGANRVRLGSGNSDGGTSGSRQLGPSPSRTLVSSLRRNRERVQGDHNAQFNSPQSIASDSLASTIAANAAILSSSSRSGQQQPQSRPQPRGVRGMLSQLVRAIPETDEHPVVGYMPSPTPRTRRAGS